MAGEAVRGEGAGGAAAVAGGVAVRLRGVTKDFGSGEAKVQALRGIDLDVREGELLFIVGPSG
ncbi:MAG TPA: hypothetical protein VHF22_08745, partial [Planctomycetota bacterium]|nr:hypothetical protein [Planctomycetota bacterium]